MCWEFVLEYQRDFQSPISLLLGQYCCWIAENNILTVTEMCSKNLWDLLKDHPKKNWNLHFLLILMAKTLVFVQLGRMSSNQRPYQAGEISGMTGIDSNYASGFIWKRVFCSDRAKGKWFMAVVSDGGDRSNHQWSLPEASFWWRKICVCFFDKNLIRNL